MRPYDVTCFDFLDHLKSFAFLANLYSSCFAVSMIPTILFDYLWTKNGRWTTTRSLCYFLFCSRLVWTMRGWISTFLWYRIPPVDCSNLRMFFQQMSSQQITLMRPAWIMERLAMTCRVLVILVCFVAMLSLIVQLCFAAMLCFRILFATIIPFNALTRPAVVATVAHGAWCRILGLWEVLLQQTRYVCGMMSWQSSPWVRIFLSSQVVLEIAFTIYGWCHDSGGSIWLCGEGEYSIILMLIFSMDQHGSFRSFPPLDPCSFEVIFVKASDRTLHWILRYIRWMHVNPFGHDQNGWDDPCLALGTFFPGFTIYY